MADKAHGRIDRKLAAMERHLTEIYTEAQGGIQKKAAAYFEKFAKADEEKRDLVRIGRLTEAEYEAWRKGKMMYGKRFTELKENIAQQLLRVNETATAYINGQLPEVYSLGYNALEGTVDGVGGYSFTLVDADTVRTLATADGSLLPSRVLDPAKDIPWNMKKVNAQVLQGILQGESIPDIAGRMQNVAEMNRTAAVRTARTMVTGAENKGRMDSYARAEADGILLQKEWLATNDGRVRHWHAELDGQLRDREEPFENAVGKIMFPGDPSADGANVYNCRCSMAAKVIGFGKKNETNGLTQNNENGIISMQELFKKKRNVEETERSPISDKRFNELTIEAKKNGAEIIRCKPGDSVYEHLENNKATASCIGNILIFRTDATISEVLEETYHYKQNLDGTNSDKPLQLRVILNEIDAKEYVISNAKKYSVPRKEISEIKLQLESYKNELEKVTGKE